MSTTPTVASPSSLGSFSSFLSNVKSDVSNLTTFPSAAKLKPVGLSDAQIASEQRNYGMNVAYTAILIGGGAALGGYLKGPLGAIIGGLAGLTLNYGRHRISLSL